MGTEKHSGNGGEENSCCQVCNCLGYCAKQNEQGTTRPKLKIISPRTFRDFEKSANSGCRYCDYTVQSFHHLGDKSDNPVVELLCYSDSPTELHSGTNEDDCDVVEIYPCADSKSSLPKVANDVPRENNPDLALRFIKDNYQECKESHKECAQLVSTLPKRVLKISEKHFHLVEPDEGTKAPYATLSYSWGGEEKFQITTKSYKWLTDGFEKAKLPIIFQDVAMVAQSLGIEYVWVDRLCIIQDDDKDWEEQAAQMGQIYELATVTIAASLCGSPHKSLFVRRNAKYEEFELCDEPERRTGDVVFKARRKIPFGMHAKTGRSRDVDPLDTRAWGLQEKLLSRRLISFTGGEIQWTCQRLRTCECRRKTYQPQPLFNLPIKEAGTRNGYGVAKSWSKIVESYAERNLTFETDRLPALSGMAKKFHGLTDFTYVAGLWQETIWYDLMWQCDTVGSKAENVESFKSPAYTGPSFSWVSTPSPVNYRLARHTYPGTRIHHMDIVDYHYSTRGPDKFGRAKKAWMRIQGMTVDACLRRNATRPEEFDLLIEDTIYPPNADQRKICEFSIDVHHRGRRTDSAVGQSRFTLNDTSDRPGTGDGDIPVLLMGIYSVHHRNYLYQNFLILRPSLLGSGQYERIGIGSGKIYNKNDTSELVQPFDWLSVEFRGKSRSPSITADRLIHLL